MLKHLKPVRFPSSTAGLVYEWWSTLQVQAVFKPPWVLTSAELFQVIYAHAFRPRINQKSVKGLCHLQSPLYMSIASARNMLSQLEMQLQADGACVPPHSPTLRVMISIASFGECAHCPPFQTG